MISNEFGSVFKQFLNHKNSSFVVRKLLNNFISARNNTASQVRFYANPAGIPGSGAGKGGGGGGAVRESGGGLGKYGAAQEEGYFFNKQRELLEKIKRKMKKEPEKSPELLQKEDK